MFWWDGSRLGEWTSSSAMLQIHIETLGKTTTVWLKDLANFKDCPEDWGDVFQAGIDAEIAHRPHAIGYDDASLRFYRDGMLLKLLVFHEKLDLN